MLEELSKQDGKWREIAYKICGCRTQADDLVNEMYLKLMNKTKCTDSYVYSAIKHIYLDTFKNKNKPVSIEDLHYLEDQTTNTTKLRYEALEMISDLSFFEREVLLQTHEKSLRNCEKDTRVPYQVFYYHKTKALNKLKKKYGLRKSK